MGQVVYFGYDKYIILILGIIYFVFVLVILILGIIIDLLSDLDISLNFYL